MRKPSARAARHVDNRGVETRGADYGCASAARHETLVVSLKESVETRGHDVPKCRQS